MAIMIPDEPPTKRGSVFSENEFWTELKHQLSDDFYVYHSLPYLTAKSRQGEVDFLVLHPKWGMLVIECKGRGIARGENGKWYREYRGKRQNIRPPMEQAAAQIRAVVQGLREPVERALGISGSRPFPVVYGWALAFPLAQRGDINLPLDLQPEVLIDSRDIAQGLEEKVVEAFKFHARKIANPPMLDRDEFSVLRTIVCPPMQLKETLAGEIDLNKRALKRLSDSQFTVMRGLINQRRFQVRGGAGTGKTVLILHGARLLAEDGKRVLITCFNIKLAEYIARTVNGWSRLAGKVDVYYFHQLCELASEDLGGVLHYPGSESTNEEVAKFWQETAPGVLAQAAEQGELSVGPWDAVFVDEAQDFARHWWDILESYCLKDETSQMGIFYDEGQSIFAHGAALPEWGGAFQLVENYRNTRSICESLQQLYDLPMEPHNEALPGVKPRVFEQGDDETTRQVLGRLLNKLINEENIRRSQIAILTPNSPANSSLGGADEIGGQPIIFDLNQWGQGVLHSTISGFKGLEADIVIMADIDPSNPRCSPEDRYAGASRAKYRLFIFQKADWLRLN